LFLSYLVVSSVREIPYITVDKQPNGDELLSMVITLPVITTTEVSTIFNIAYHSTRVIFHDYYC